MPAPRAAHLFTSLWYWRKEDEMNKPKKKIVLTEQATKFLLSLSPLSEIRKAKAIKRGLGL